jgi:fluoroacetyl-CoA thioesterase
MELVKYIQPDLSNESTFIVKEEHSALHIGSGTLGLLATPMMIAFMERTARELLDQHLPDGYSSVGMHVDVRHLAPTPIGKSVRVACRILEVDTPRVKFSVDAWDEHEKVGEGHHLRAVIEVARLLRRVEAKSG